MNKIQKILLSLIIVIFCVSNAQHSHEIVSDRASTKKAMEFYLYNSLNFMLSRSLYVAADLHIADLLQEKEYTLTELAQKTLTHEKSLERMLNLLLMHSIFSKDEVGRYHNTELSSYLIQDHPKTVRPLVLHEDDTRWNCYGNLGTSVRTGEPVFNMLYKMPYFEYIAHDTLLNNRFNEAMTCISDFEEEVLSSSYPFYQFSHIIDIGGGRGGLLRKILHNHPLVHATLADLPSVIENHELLLEFSDRICVMPLNFFEPMVLTADLYMLKRVLHDWNDDQVVQILKNVKSTMQPNSKLLVMESLIDNNNEDSKLIAHVDLILLSVFGGKERTLEEFNKLFTESGFRIMNVYKTESLVSIIECSSI